MFRTVHSAKYSCSVLRIERLTSNYDALGQAKEWSKQYTLSKYSTVPWHEP